MHKIVCSAICIFHLTHCISIKDTTKKSQVFRAVLVGIGIFEKMGLESNHQKNKGRWMPDARFWSQYRAYLRSVEWRQKTSQMMTRAGRVCEICHKREAVQVHHLTYDRVFNEHLDGRKLKRTQYGLLRHS